MEYTINKLAKLAGVSTRTLRYYDQLGLLAPARVSSAGYRIYGRREVERLQDIMFYRELGMPLEDIKTVLLSRDFDRLRALEGHLAALREKHMQLELLIANVEKTIKVTKGEATMTDNEKFKGFKKKLIDNNEEKYGTEIREKYGDAAIDESNAKLMGVTKEQYAEFEALSAELNETLKNAFEQGDPASPLAQKAASLHKQWLCFYWSTYSKQAHMGVTQMYVQDPRFTEYYDKIAPGCAPFLRDAVEIFCN